MTETMQLDDDIARLCDAAADFPRDAMADQQAALLAMCGFSLDQRCVFALAMLAAQDSQRIFTGYQDKAARTERAHLDFSNGFKFAPARLTADDRAKAEAVKWGVAA